jgi:cell division protease FtsH
MNRGVFSWLILIALAVISFVLVTQNRHGAEERTGGELLNYIEQGFVESIVVGEGQFEAVIKDGAVNPPKNNRIFVNANVGAEHLYEQIMELDPLLIKEKPTGGLWAMIFINALLPVLLIFALLWFFIFRGLRNGGGGGGMLGNFGRSRHKVISKEMTEVSLDDVAGVEEAKDEVGEIIKFLKNPKKFQRLGGRIPRGVLLIGAPGCGKTLLAKAVAGEAEVPFFSISGSDFVEMFVGVGASRVRDLFKQAKDSSPCIIFLDEIDAVGRRRGTGVSGGGGHDEREQTLNAILVEMDGFESNDQVIVIAATNRSDVLDPALTRPGRFDRQITVHLPDVKGRYEILQVHAAKVKLADDVDLEKLARGTPMFSGADLAAIINESAIIATLADKEAVEQCDLEEARDKVKFGRASKSRKIDEDERVGTAYHEAGHTVIQHLLPDADPLHKVTIIPRGQAMGATMSLPDKDRYGYGQKYIHATLRVLCGGRIAEQRKTGDITSGAAMDIRMATNYARHMILEWGMSEKLGFIDYASPAERESLIPEKAYSEETAQVIDEEVRRLTDEAYADATKMLDENWDKVVAVSEALLRYETLSAEEVAKLMAGESLDKPTISDIIDTPPSSSSSEPAKEKPDADELGEGGPIPAPA